MVVDELHMVCDPHRGLPLELLITKLLFSRHADSIQLIGMSATMGGESVTAGRYVGGGKGGGRWGQEGGVSSGGTPAASLQPIGMCATMGGESVT